MLFSYCSDKNVIKIVEDIIGPEIVAVHTMLLNKPPDANPEMSLHPLHQVKCNVVAKSDFLELGFSNSKIEECLVASLSEKKCTFY